MHPDPHHPTWGDLTHGSLFAGIGGIDLGFHRAGMRTVWQVERDEFCRRVLAKNFPDVTRYGDIHDIDWSTVEHPDVVSGGFPCQPFSSASRGRNHGTDDDRYLWPAFREAVRTLRPRYVVVENVPGLRHRDTGALHAVLGDLARLGFDAQWGSPRASDAGALHRRERVVLIAYTDRDRQPLCPFDGQAPGQPSLPEPVRGWWLPAPGDLRGDDGLPEGVDPVARRRALGNAMVPQVAQWVGEMVVAHASRS